MKRVANDIWQGRQGNPGNGKYMSLFLNAVVGVEWCLYRDDDNGDPGDRHDDGDDNLLWMMMILTIDGDNGDDINNYDDWINFNYMAMMMVMTISRYTWLLLLPFPLTPGKGPNKEIMFTYLKQILFTKNIKQYISQQLMIMVMVVVIMMTMMMMMMMIDIKGKGLGGGEKSIDYLFFPQTRRCWVNTHIICELKIFFEKF